MKRYLIGLAAMVFIASIVLCDIGIGMFLAHLWGNGEPAAMVAVLIGALQFGVLAVNYIDNGDFLQFRRK